MIADLIRELFGVIGVGLAAPANLAEFFPWFVTVLLCAGFVSTFLNWIRILVSSFGKGGA